MAIRGIRGAINVDEDRPEAIRQATCALLEAIMHANPGLMPAEVASVILTVTQDLSSMFPASAVRESPGWEHVPLLCANEIPVPDDLPLCLRVLIHWNTDLPQSAIRHVYLGQAARLRPDVTG